MLKFVLPALATIGAGIALAPAQAQSTPGGSLIIYGSDRCPANTICVRRGEGERYRIPPAMHRSRRQAGEARSPGTFADVSATGTGSCTAVGGGGRTGCLRRFIDQGTAQRKADQADVTPDAGAAASSAAVSSTDR